MNLPTLKNAAARLRLQSFAMVLSLALVGLPHSAQALQSCEGIFADPDFAEDTLEKSMEPADQGAILSARIDQALTMVRSLLANPLVPGPTVADYLLLPSNSRSETISKGLRDSTGVARDASTRLGTNVDAMNKAIENLERAAERSGWRQLVGKLSRAETAEQLSSQIRQTLPELRKSIEETKLENDQLTEIYAKASAESREIAHEIDFLRGVIDRLFSTELALPMDVLNRAHVEIVPALMNAVTRLSVVETLSRQNVSEVEQMISRNNVTIESARLMIDANLTLLAKRFPQLQKLLDDQAAGKMTSTISDDLNATPAVGSLIVGGIDNVYAHVLQNYENGTLAVSYEGATYILKRKNVALTTSGLSYKGLAVGDAALSNGQYAVTVVGIRPNGEFLVSYQGSIYRRARTKLVRTAR